MLPKRGCQILISQNPTSAFALKDKVAADLDRLQAEDIVNSTKFLQWVAPIVPIVKKNGSIRTISKKSMNVPQKRFLKSFC